jgi:hypothetical protein
LGRRAHASLSGLCVRRRELRLYDPEHDRDARHVRMHLASPRNYWRECVLQKQPHIPREVGIRATANWGMWGKRGKFSAISR